MGKEEAKASAAAANEKDAVDGQSYPERVQRAYADLWVANLI